MTKGEYRVGINFNPSADDMVGQIKRAAAALIDLIETIPAYPVGDEHHADCAQERGRLKAIAQTEIESAARWAVAAATKPSPT